MNTAKRYIMVVFFSVSLLVLALLMILLGNNLEREVPESVTFREVLISFPPPPPPPPGKAQSGESSASRLNMSSLNTNSPVLMAYSTLDVEIPRGALEGNGVGVGDWGDGIGIEFEFEKFNPEQLDGYPQVLRAPYLAYPDDARRERVHSFEIRLHILIDEEGKAYLIGIVENPYPELNADLPEFVEGTRFTPPTVSGEPVWAEYIWPILQSEL